MYRLSIRWKKIMRKFIFECSRNYYYYYLFLFEKVFGRCKIFPLGRITFFDDVWMRKIKEKEKGFPVCRRRRHFRILHTPITTKFVSTASKFFFLIDSCWTWQWKRGKKKILFLFIRNEFSWSVDNKFVSVRKRCERAAFDLRRSAGRERETLFSFVKKKRKRWIIIIIIITVG